MLFRSKVRNSLLSFVNKIVSINAGRITVTSNQWKLGNLKRAKRVVLSMTVPTLAMVCLLWFGAARAENTKIVDSPIPYDHLANQETDPFLFHGKLMDENNPRWHQFRRVLRKYPDVRDCLIIQEQGEVEPNLLLIDWQKTGLGRGAQVCIFLIARSLGTIERHRQWLEFHEFRVVDLMQIFSSDYIPPFETKPVAIMSGFWTTEQYRAKNPSWLASLTGLETVQGYSVVIGYSYQQLVVGISASSRSK